MPQPHLRSRTKRRLKLKLPSGKNRVRYVGKNPSISLCVKCSRPLGGIPHVRLVERHKLNRSKRRIWRPYGGQVCSNCLRVALKKATRPF